MTILIITQLIFTTLYIYTTPLAKSNTCPSFPQPRSLSPPARARHRCLLLPMGDLKVARWRSALGPLSPICKRFLSVFLHHHGTKHILVTTVNNNEQATGHMSPLFVSDSWLLILRSSALLANQARADTRDALLGTGPMSSLGE